jgi:glycosyltransferase involved in cell wall biosynthesis
MRIAVIDTTVHGDQIGGGHLIVVHLLAGLVERGHDVHFVCAATPNAVINDRIIATGVTIDQRPWGAAALVDDATPHFAEWLNRLQPDVHLISASWDLGWTVLPLLEPSIASLTIGHNDERTFYDPVKHYAPFLTRAIGVSEEICRKYIDECGMPPERVEWIPYGVEVMDREPVDHGESTVRLIYVGRFENVQKRISDVVAIVRRLTDRGVDFRFDLVGDGVEMPAVKAALAAEIGAGKVVLHGWVDSERVIRKMRDSDVFILASAYEGFCISLIEAMANGCTPVVTDIRSGNKQLVEDAANGYIVPVGDIDAFVDRIGLLAGDRERLLTMRRSAWSTGREYGVDRMIDSYVECFERAIETMRTSPRKLDPGFPLMESCRSKYPLWLRRIKARLA